VEVLEGHRQFVEVMGNMQPLTKTTEPLYVGFRPFRENRLPLVVRLRDLKAEPAGQVVFFPTPRTSDTPPTPICVLSVVLPGPVGHDAQAPDLEVSEIQLSEALKSTAPGTCLYGLIIEYHDFKYTWQSVVTTVVSFHQHNSDNSDYFGHIFLPKRFTLVFR